ncbi:uncharacterized protein A1O9_06071 [Exophiala aquamarina CBS 119918]|uniref:RING-type domain-containing protein n=1 Tax=Exophiala aquamarina CBS 119918 TaxID=1182545 RepID=A0A072PEF1_9EURO|nr:uncharacterized protein A1O9_06071 [Exophiala aquamarina CBS 119918]KEF58147.1 hypothetical protein A1O9_06071 [Exophiala aquamarina CBS 119918]
MASSQNSPVLVQHASAPHTLSPSLSVVSIPPFSPDSLTEPSTLPEPIFPPPTSVPEIEQNTTTVAVEEADTEMADAAAAAPAPAQQPSNVVEIPTPSQEEVPSVSEHLSSTTTGPVEDTIPPPPDSLPQQDDFSPPPPPMAAVPSPEVPDWVTWEDDLSTPTEEEMTQINARDFELSALDVPSVEKRIYQDVDDPDQRPVKKLRLSWVIKNLRGTRNKPNSSRVMISPPAEVDGNYWQIKFYPRGNKCSSMSAYIRCSRIAPEPESEAPDSTFSFYEGTPDADLGNDAVPIQTFTVEAENRPASKATPSDAPESHDSQKQESSQGTSQGTDGQDVHPVPRESTTSADESKYIQPADEAWRVPAQLGVIMYNPEEPRTCTYMSSEHQFSRANDDWGWTNFHGPWKEIHRRQYAQRTPLLRNDTIAIDAYIRIFDDPSQALWWHPSETEPQWDSKTLAGYHPMGTPPLYHSPAVAGITAWLLLAPFRQVIQAIDAGQWRRNSQIRPRPLICQLQVVMFLMRWLRKDKDTYVDVNPVIESLKEHGESFTDVVTFWEMFRRGIELELEEDPESMRMIAKIFDSPDGRFSVPPLPVEGVSDIQQGLDRVLEAKNFRGRLPDFLSLPLAREKFDKKSREWKLLHDRVILNDEIMAVENTAEGDRSSYTLYGFMVHVGERNSAKIYSVLRPNGPNTKWLAFEDGDGNKIFSYTRKRINEFEGLEGQALKDFTSTRQTAYLAMYIRTSCLPEYLPGALEPYRLPRWLASSLTWEYQDKHDPFVEEMVEENPDEVNVELYSEEGVYGREGLLDMFNIKKQSNHKGLYHCLTLPKSTTYQDLRTAFCGKLGIGNSSSLRLFIMRYSDIGNYTSALMEPVQLSRNITEEKPLVQPICLWYSVLKTREEIELFGDPIPSVETESTQPDPELSGESDGPTDLIAAVAPPSGIQLAAADLEQASVQEAVVADLERVTTVREPELVLSEEQVEDADTPMQLEDSPPTAEESLLADVPHGHLIDAANHHTSTEVVSDPNAQLPEDPTTLTSLTGAEERVIAAVIAQDGEIMDFTMQPATDTQASESQSTDSSESTSSASSATSTPDPQVRNIYGFIQIFDTVKQNFMVFGTFFAKCDDKVKDFIRTRMGYAADKEFIVWRRESPVEGSMIEDHENFDDRRFVNGVDIIVGEVLGDSAEKALEQQGKFSNPFALSRYLRMVERRHPIESVTSVTPVEVATFGTDYYKGPLVNGRAHGPNCLCITSTGNTYEGPLVCNKKCGRGGKMTYQNGDTYDGEWDADERHGQGTFVESRTGNKYVGGFEYGKRWGMGTTYWQVADEQADLCQICYSEEIDALFFDCGHICSCVECARQCEICPICRRSVKQVVKMFRA